MGFIDGLGGGCEEGKEAKMSLFFLPGATGTMGPVFIAMRETRGGVKLGTEIKEFRLGSVRFEVPARHPKGNGRWPVGYSSLGFKGEVGFIDVIILSLFTIALLR